MLLLLLSCRPSTPPPPPPSVPSETSPTSDTGTPPAPLAFTAGPEWARNTAGARLVGHVTVQTSEPTSIEITVDDGGRTWVHAGTEVATEHRVPILGLRPDALHVLDVTVTDRHGRQLTGELEVQSSPLPDDFPTFTVTSDPARMEPGLTLLVIGAYLSMLDAEGTVRWFLPDLDKPYEATVTPRGTLLVQEGRTRIVEYELDGSVAAGWRAARTVGEPASAIPVDVEALHHDVHELPNGNLLALSIERRFYEDYPSSESNPSARPRDAWVAGDVVVELQRDGTVVHSWPLLDRLDPYRIAYNSLRGDHWETFYGGDDVKDWSHANGIFYDAARDEVVVSLRHQDAVVALDHATGELSWILAPEANWAPPFDGYLLRPATPDLLQPYHQHAAKITPSGALMLFDNGNERTSPFDPGLPDDQIASRGAELLLDHTAGTWSLGWSLTTTPPLFSGSLGDCDPLPRTGNVLVTFGNIKDEAYDGARILEATRDSPPEVVFELRLPQPLTAYRAQRVTGVLPGF